MENNTNNISVVHLSKDLHGVNVLLCCVFFKFWSTFVFLSIFFNQVSQTFGYIKRHKQTGKIDLKTQRRKSTTGKGHLKKKASEVCKTKLH